MRLEVYNKLKPKKERKRKGKKEKLNEKDIKELMGSRYYKRCSGAIRQVR